VAVDEVRWQSALAGYQPSVTPSRVRPLGSERVPFAKYFIGMHARIHPLFGDSFLESLGSAAATDPMNDADLHTRLEIVIDRTGKVFRIGVVRTSGLPAFDAAVLEAVDRAQPFERPPAEVVSADGNVYMHWIFFRDERCACSTMNASPFLLR
jgi:TonB family protein